MVVFTLILVMCLLNCYRLRVWGTELNTASYLSIHSWHCSLCGILHISSSPVSPSLRTHQEWQVCFHHVHFLINIKWCLYSRASTSCKHAVLNWMKFIVLACRSNCACTTYRRDHQNACICQSVFNCSLWWGNPRGRFQYFGTCMHRHFGVQTRWISSSLMNSVLARRACTAVRARAPLAAFNWDIVYVTMLMKKALGEMQTRRAGCSKAEPKFFASLQTPYPGARDGQNLISWRWSLPSPADPVWSGSMHTISSYRGNRPTNPQTDRTDYNTLRR